MENGITEEGKWETVDSEYLFRRPWLTVRRDKVRLPDGRINPEFYVLEYPDWVNVIAITEDGLFVMEKQFRYGLGKTCYELAEETGYEGGKWQKLMTVSGNPSTTNNITHCFLATGVKKVSSQHLDATEDLEVCLMTKEEVRDLLDCDQIRQALMAAPLWKFFAGSL